MMKKNKLYTVSRFNRPMFMPTQENLFPNGGNVWQGLSDNWQGYDDSLLDDRTTQYMNSKNWLGISKQNNPFSKGNLMQAKEGIMNAGSGLASAGIGLLGGAAGNAIAGGKTSKAGELVGSIGSTVLGMAGTAIGGPLGRAIGSALGSTLGGLTNAAFGSELNQQKIAEIENNNAQREAENNVLYGVNSTDDLFNSVGNMTNAIAFNEGDIGSDGWFSSDAEDKYDELLAEQDRINRMRGVAIGTATNKVNRNQYITNMKRNLTANGGPLFMHTPTNLFDFGGDLQVHGGDYPTGLTHISAGGSHESNPNDGVQIGVDPEGVPNLVEEGEVVWNDYVYSNRIKVDNETKKKFHIGKKREITYADLAKKLEKEISERPNDPISRAGFEAEMHDLADQQERQKQEMEAERAKAAFEALSPEEQVSVMQQAAAEEQAIANQQAQQEAIAEQQAMQQQPMVQADGSEAIIGQEPQPMMAEGGRINRFDDGGDLDPIAKALFKRLGFSTMSDYFKWQEENGIDNDLWKNANGRGLDAWKKVFADEAFRKAVNDPALLDVIEKGYNFGTVEPSKDGIVFTDPDRGNWDRQMFEGWDGSKDDAWIELIKKHGADVLRGMKREDLEKAFKETNAYKNTTAWLKKDPENMRRYLDSVLKTSSSASAKKHALQFVNEDGSWKDPKKIPTYAQVFGENGKGVRETYPGTYWHSVREANIGNRARNYVWNPEDEVWEDVVGDVGKDWALDSSYDWYNADENLNDKVNYYYRSEGQDDFKPVTEKEIREAEAAEKMKNAKPKYKKGYFGLDTLGPLTALTMQGLGVGKPDMSEMDRTLAKAARSYHTATNKYLGNYLKYQPLDIWFEQAKMDANARATDRAILNNAAPIGTKMAGLLASGYNNQIANGELYRKALEYNDAKRAQTAEFNRGTDQFNADAFNRLSQFNASEANRHGQFLGQLGMEAAKERMDANAGWYNSLYGNVGSLFSSLNKHKKENDTHNMIADMAANGLFGIITPDSPIGRNYLQWVNSSSNGGNIKRKKGKRGLTF